MTNKNKQPLIHDNSKKAVWILITLLLCILAILIGIVLSQKFQITTFTPNEEVKKTDSITSTEHYQKQHPKFYNKKKYTYYNDNKPYNFDTTYYKARTFYSTHEEKPLMFDLNLVDSIDLQALRGVGPSYARRIIKYREKLGGYVRIEQLQEVYGMTKELYTEIIQHLTISETPTKKVNINSENIKELMQHPYIDYYLAKAIIEFHKTYGEFTSVEDLKKVHLIDDKTYTKLQPYISTN